MAGLEQIIPVVGKWPIDILVLLVFGGIVAFDAIKNGTRRAAVFALAVPLASVLYGFLRSSPFLGVMVVNLKTPVAQVGIFGLIFVALFILIYLMLPSTGTSTGIFPLFAALVGASAAVILALAWQMSALSTIWPPSAMMQSVFAVQNRFFWFVAVYLVLAFARK